MKWPGSSFPSSERGWNGYSPGSCLWRGPVLSPRERTWLVKRIIDDAVGLGVLEPLVADHTVTEIMVNGTEDVFVERSGRIERVPTRFTSEAELYQLIDRHRLLGQSPCG